MSDRRPPPQTNLPRELIAQVRSGSLSLEEAAARLLETSPPEARRTMVDAIDFLRPKR